MSKIEIINHLKLMETKLDAIESALEYKLGKILRRPPVKVVMSGELPADTVWWVAHPCGNIIALTLEVPNFAIYVSGDGGLTWTKTVDIDSSHGPSYMALGPSTKVYILCAGYRIYSVDAAGEDFTLFCDLSPLGDFTPTQILTLTVGPTGGNRLLIVGYYPSTPTKLHILQISVDGIADVCSVELDTAIMIAEPYKEYYTFNVVSDVLGKQAVVTAEYSWQVSPTSPSAVRSFLLFSEDGGDTWKTVYTSNQYRIAAPCTDGNGKILAVLLEVTGEDDLGSPTNYEAKYILKSEDGGATFNQLTSAEDLQIACYPPGKLLYCADRDTLYVNSFNMLCESLDDAVSFTPIMIVSQAETPYIGDMQIIFGDTLWFNLMVTTSAGTHNQLYRTVSEANPLQEIRRCFDIKLSELATSLEAITVEVLPLVGLKNVLGTQVNPPTEDTLLLVKSKTDNLDVALSTIKAQTDKFTFDASNFLKITYGAGTFPISHANLDIALSALRDAVIGASSKSLTDLDTDLLTTGIKVATLPSIPTGDNWAGRVKIGDGTNVLAVPQAGDAIGRGVFVLGSDYNGGTPLARVLKVDSSGRLTCVLG